ncbi:MAG: DNA polymerase [candidate division WOR-3 bacterium]
MGKIYNICSSCIGFSEKNNFILNYKILMKKTESQKNILIICEFPENSKNEKFLDTFFTNIFQNKDYNIFLSYLFKCSFTPSDKKKRDKALENCSYFLKKEIEELKPIIISIGYLPSYFFSEDINWQEGIIRKKIGNQEYFIILAYNPLFYVSKNEEYTKNALFQFKKRILKYIEKIEKKDFFENNNIQKILISNDNINDLDPLFINLDLKEISCDFETNSLNLNSINDIISVGITDGKTSYFIDFYAIKNKKRAFENFIDILLYAEKIIFHNYKFDRNCLIEILKFLNKEELIYEIDSKIEDIFLKYFIYNQKDNFTRSYSLSALSYYAGTERYKNIVERENIIKSYIYNKENFIKYNLFDSEITFYLYKNHNKIFNYNKKAEFFLKNILYPAEIMLSEIEKHGIKIDLEKLAKLEKEIFEEIRNIENYFFTKYRIKNLMSPQQKSLFFQRILDELKITKNELVKNEIEITKTGLISSSSSNLEKLFIFFENLNNREISNEIKEDILLLKKYSSISKLHSSFIISYKELAKDSFIYPSFSLTGTATGRLSSFNPNFHQIPRSDDEFSKKFRECIIPQKYKYIVSVDFSQIELRVAGVLSKDSILINAFKNNVDLHTETARIIMQEVFNIDYESYIKENGEEKFKSEWRQKAKSVNFGILYGMGKKRFQEIFKIQDEILAEKLFRLIKERYKEYYRWAEKEYEKAINNLYIETPFGRRRFLEPHLDNYEIFRITGNTIIQSVASDLNLITSLFFYFENKNLKILTKNKGKILYGLIHDAIVFESDNPEKDFIEIKNIVDSILPEFCKFFEIYIDIPFEIEMKYNENYAF